MTVLADLVRDLNAGGVVGVDAQAQAIYLCNISRKLKKPQSYIAYGPSAAGKSFLISTLLSLVPDDDVDKFDSASDTAVFYNQTSLAHRIVYVPETANLTEAVQGYLRVLVSEGELVRDFTLVEGKKRSTIKIRRDGPCLVAQSSVDAIHPENETRALLIEIPDGPAQTRLVMHSIAAQDEGILTAIDPTPWLALDAIIPAGVDVILERGLGTALASLIPATSVRMRRDFRAILTLIKAHALLNMANRPVVNGYTIATVEDYEAVREILEPVVGAQNEQAVHPEVREFVEMAISLGNAKGLPAGTVTAKEVGLVLGIDGRTAWRRAKRAMRGEFLRNGETRPRQPAQLYGGAVMPDAVMLPTPREVRLEMGSTDSTRGQADSTPDSTVSITDSSDSTTYKEGGVTNGVTTPVRRRATPVTVESVESPIKQVASAPSSGQETVASPSIEEQLAAWRAREAGSEG